ncbi:hypothetical protein BGZ92_008631 [Podila epicladia]|nr:hypothetical protein BGZ92_008631 [Podila epicladia]
MTMTKPHPLYISELVYRTGWFLPNKPTPVRKRKREFYRTHLSACVQVNHLWRRTLIPLLWMIFYADVVVHRDIPLPIVQANSHHIRYAYFNCRLQIPILRSTRLRKLNVKHLEPMAIRDLTRSNPQLESLTIDIDSESIALSLELILEPLAELTRLKLIGTTPVILELLVQSLRHLTKLRRLKVKGLHSEQSFYMPPSQISASTDNTPLPKLSSVTELHLISEWHAPDLADLVRYCPASYHAPEFPSARLSSNIHECCPNLTSLRAVRKEYVTQPFKLTQHDHLNLLLSTSCLVHYDFTVENFNTAFCDALLSHGPSLETVRIVCNSVEFWNAQRVLSSCPKLTSFSLVFGTKFSRPEEGLAIFAQSWDCPQLRELELRGFKPGRCNTFYSRLDTAFREQWEHEESHERLPSVVEISEGSLDSLSSGRSEQQSGVKNWMRVLVHHAPPDRMFGEKLAREGWAIAEWKGGNNELQGRDSSRLEKIIEDKVFERVFAMPCMRKVTLENYVFVKKGRAKPLR